METYESLHDRVQQKIRDKQIDLVVKLVQAILAEDALVIVDAVRYEGAEPLDIESAGNIYDLILQWDKPVEVKEFVKSYLFDGQYSEGIKELQAQDKLEDSYDNQF